MLTYADVCYSTNAPMLARAVKLFEGGAVRGVEGARDGYAATVVGTSPYHVYVSMKRITSSLCSCYMGQNGDLCKHVIALALAVLHDLGLVDAAGLPAGASVIDETHAIEHIQAGMRYIRVHTGSSRTWFEYQRKLSVGTGIIMDGVCALPVTLDTAVYLWKTVLKLSKKLREGGVDDSEGAVGRLIEAIIDRIARMAHADDGIMKYMVPHCHDKTGFGFENELEAQLSDKPSRRYRR